MARLRMDSDERQKLRNKLPADLVDVFIPIDEDIQWLHAKWGQYRSLFARNEATVDTLNKAASFFFWYLQDVLFDDILAHVSRLTDPPQQGQYENLSLPKLAETIRDPILKPKIAALVEQIKQRVVVIRGHRHKRLAHSDYRHATGQTAKALSGVSRKEIEDALDLFRSVLNEIRTHYGVAYVAYRQFFARRGADWLVRVLERGLETLQRGLNDR